MTKQQKGIAIAFLVGLVFVAIFGVSCQVLFVLTGRTTAIAAMTESSMGTVMATILFVSVLEELLKDTKKGKKKRKIRK